MTTANIVQYETLNYIVPAAGSTHAVEYSAVWTGTPFAIDWRQFKIDYFPFVPQGVFVDNTAGIGPVTINVQPVNWNVIVPAGQQAQCQFPAPNQQQCTITGNGQAQIIFVDFPVLPGLPSGSAQNVTLTSPLPLPVSVPVNVAGAPYRTQQQYPNGEANHFQILAAATTNNATPAIANQDLQKVVVTVSGDADLGVAGKVSLTLTLNGVTIWVGTLYLTAAIQSLAPIVTLAELDFSNCGFNAAAGNLTATLGTALATGTVDVNAYYRPV